jgi:hypothetical protein
MTRDEYELKKTVVLSRIRAGLIHIASGVFMLAVTVGMIAVLFYTGKTVWNAVRALFALIPFNH